MLSTFALQILAVEEEPEGIDLILPETKELIAGIIAFSIVFFFVWKWAWPVLLETLERRQQAITGQLQEAEKAKVEAESLLVDYQNQLSGAREEANQIIDEARATADAMKSDMVERAESEAAGILDKARADVSAERDRAATALQRDVADLSVQMAEKVVEGSIDSDAQRALVEQYLNELGGLTN